MVADQPPPVLEPPVPAAAHEAPVRKEPPVPRQPGWALLDPFTARHQRSFGLTLLRSRRLPEITPNTGYGLTWGESLSTLRGSFIAGAMLENELRLVPADAVSLSLSRYQWEAGPRLGRFEPLVRVGFSVLQAGVGSSGPSFGMFSPRVGAGLWLKLPGLRLGLSAYGEYFWRWVGDESAFVRGLSFELQPDAPPLRKRRRPAASRVTSSPSAPASR